MVRDLSHIFYDILSNIERLQALVKDRTFEEFSADWVAQYAAERCIEVISEACKRISDEMKSTRPEINWGNIRGMGNFLRHEYQNIDPKVVWKVATQEMTGLRAAIPHIRDSDSDTTTPTLNPLK